VTLNLTVPWSVLASDNRRNVRRGGRAHGWDYIAARERIAMIAMDAVRGERPMFAGDVAVRLSYYPPDLRRRDASNTLKVLLDGMSKVVYTDDCKVKDLSYLVYPPDGTEPRVEIEVSARRAA
jgi:Holliday junction resolvase RusA-like endonuclease